MTSYKRGDKLLYQGKEYTVKFTIVDNGKTSTINAKNETEARRLYRQTEYPTRRSLPSHVFLYGEGVKAPVGRLVFTGYNTPGISPGHRRRLLGTAAIIPYHPPGISNIANDLVIDTDTDPEFIRVRRRLGFAKWESWKQRKPPETTQTIDA